MTVEMEFAVVTLKIRRFGNSLGVVLPKEVTTRLNMQEGAPLYLTETPDGGYRLVPFNPDFQTKMEKAEEIIRRYPDALHVLAR